MNYITINGVKSTTIKGLLIMELPHIIKPLKRTIIEEIDGVDGDIIQDVGYSAYDKEVLIGLHGDYDIDQIIEYFNSNGIISFSNESDKYYNFTILEQIDFERLLRYKTATVIIHVQPFKWIKGPDLVIDNSGNTKISAFELENKGNIYSKPIITVYGSGDIKLLLNQEKILDISLGNEEYITINVEKLEAYKENVLKNRLIIGDYDKLRLNKGKNILSWEGNVTKLIISKISRWI